MNDLTTVRLRADAVSAPRAARAMLALLSGLQLGRLRVHTPEGQAIEFSGRASGPEAVVEIKDWGVLARVLRRGGIGFAETYCEGRWTTPDLRSLLLLAALNRDALSLALRGRWWGGMFYRLRHWLRDNTRAGSRRNIHAHYDLGNAFYRSWLDATMTYSSALFESEPSRTLEEAQVAKFERILRQIGARPGQRILEVGCGWGGFAEYAARTRGCSVLGITVSREQLIFATERIRAAGLEAQVSLRLCDYRDVQGTYDHVVSVEMYEAVGARHWPRYFQVLTQRVAPGGRVLIQGITIADHLFDRYRRETDFIQQYVFPGGMLASAAVLQEQAGRAGLELRSALAFGEDYAETLRRWAERFNRAWGELRLQGFDGKFARLWNFYLAYCEAGFRSGSTDVMQLEFQRV